MVYRHLHNFSSFRVTSGQSCAISCLRSPERPPLSYSSCATIKTTGKSAPGRLSLHWKVPGFYAILITTDQYTKTGGQGNGGQEKKSRRGTSCTGRSGPSRTNCGARWTAGTSKTMCWAPCSTGTSRKTCAATSTGARPRPATPGLTMPKCPTPRPNRPGRGWCRKKAFSFCPASCSAMYGHGRQRTRT